MREERRKLSRHNDVAGAIDYMLRRWPSFTRFLEDGRICLTINAAERALSGLALGRKAWLFAGSDRGGQRAALLYSLIVTAKGPSSTMSIPRPVSPSIPPTGSTNCCLGTGRPAGPSPKPPDVAAPSHVFTISCVAKMLGEDEAWLQEIALELEREDGRLYVCNLETMIS